MTKQSQGYFIRYFSNALILHYSETLRSFNVSSVLGLSELAACCAFRAAAAVARFAGSPLSFGAFLTFTGLSGG